MKLEILYSVTNSSYEQTLHRLFELKTSQYSEKIAVSFKGTSITYYELNKKANYLATLLMERGAGNESPVVLILDRSIEMMISILAVLKTGSCYLPLNPSQPINRTNKIIELSGASIILHNTELDKEILKISSIDVNNVSYPVSDVPNLNIHVKPDNLAYIIYTSGSTGEPKGVMIEHRSVINRLFWMQDSYPLFKSDIVMQKTPYTFDVSVWELFGWYLNGSILHFLEPGAEKEPHTIAEVIEREKITIIHFVPSMLSLFLEYIDKYSSFNQIKSIRRVCCSGEALQVEQVKRFKKVISKNIPAELYNLYGPTEATVEVSFYDCLKNKYNFIPIGKAITNVDLYVLNEKGEVLPPGETGELYIGGVCLARGYFNKPELTNEKFKVNPYLNKRLYSTGDLATFLEDGNIKYLGRIDNQVKIRGNRVELGEIESCLLGFNGIKDSAVIAPMDEKGNAYLGAYFISDRVISTRGTKTLYTK
jgi:amino acid adenylation domain-containing protein